MTHDDDLAYTPAHVLADRLRRGDLTARALVDCYLDRIRRYDPKLHAFVEVYEDEARKRADAADVALRAGQPIGPLHGIPLACKDLLEIEGRRTTGGSMALEDRVSTVTSTAVQRLTAAGMIPLGKVHMVELAFGSWGTNQKMGTPWNPWDMQTARTPGGSSSGSGVAVSAALAPAALGSDTGGSVRIPASLCGIVGLKTTVGRVSNHGTLMLSPTLDTLGPMTRDVEDAALLFAAMHGPDANDPATLAHPPCDVLPSLKRGIAGLRLAVLDEEHLGRLDPEVESAFAHAVETLRELGARIDLIELPMSYSRLADSTGSIISAESYTLHRGWIDRDELPFDADVRARILAGRDISAADYIQTMNARTQMKAQVNAVMRDFDALLVPSTPMPPIPLTEVNQGQAPMSRLTRAVNYLDLCALAVPCGFTDTDLPISLQIVGNAYDEARVLRIGWAYENATQWHKRRPVL